MAAVMGGRETFGKLREIDNNIPVIISLDFTKDSDMEVINKYENFGISTKLFTCVYLSETLAKTLTTTD